MNFRRPIPFSTFYFDVNGYDSMFSYNVPPAPQEWLEFQRRQNAAYQKQIDKLMDEMGKSPEALKPIKTDPTLIPPTALSKVAELLTAAGKGKHASEPWRSMTPREHVAATMRHILKHLEGPIVDSEFGHLHLTHAACRLLMAVEILSKDSK